MGVCLLCSRSKEAGEPGMDLSRGRVLGEEVREIVKRRVPGLHFLGPLGAL